MSDTLLDENDESLVFVTIWDCQTTSMMSSVERSDLDFKISVALVYMYAVGALNLQIVLILDYDKEIIKKK